MKIIIDLENLQKEKETEINLNEIKEEVLNKEKKILIFKSLLLLDEYLKCKIKNLNYESWIANNKLNNYLSPEKLEEFEYRIKNNNQIMFYNLNEMKKIIKENSNDIIFLKELKEVYIYLNYPNIFYDVIEEIDNLMVNKQ